MSSSKDEVLTNTEWLSDFGLRDRDRKFVLNYLKDNNGTRAAIAAGFAPRSAPVTASKKLRNHNVASAIKCGRKLIEESVMMEADGIARRWAEIAQADVSEVVQHHYVACRYCWGRGHQFQWKTEREFRENLVNMAWEIWSIADDDKHKKARTLAIAGKGKDDRLPTDAGGYGYSVNAAPNPDCPECSGEGQPMVRFADTRSLSPSARLLYDGVEETQNGKKMRLADRSKALENLAKHLGMFAGKVEPDEENPLALLASRLMQNAAPVPVATKAQQAGSADMGDDEDVDP